MFSSSVVLDSSAKISHRSTRHILFLVGLLAAILGISGCSGVSSTGGTTPSTLAITTSSLSSGTVGAAYSATLAATGGTAPYSWTLTSGTLPAGLALNASTGAIAGTPTATASATALTFTVTDSGSPAQTKSASLSLTITAAGVTPLAITTTTLPSGIVGTAYSATLAASGGTAPYSWTSGTLPAGLALNASTGAITGTPTAAANATPLTFTVTDSASPAQSKSASFSLTIAATPPPTLSITTTSLPSGTVGVAYTTTLAATGGTTPYTWALTSGTLPAGLTLNAATGAISGTPTASATNASLTFTVTDSSSPTQNIPVTLALTIAATPPPALVITTSTLPGGNVGTLYSATLAATGGVSPYTWSLTSGTLPAGLTLNATTGAISGTPTASAANASLTFMATDSESPAQTKSVTLTLTVLSNLAISTTALPNGQDGNVYTTSLVATGGTAPYSWTLTGTLPTGLSFNTSTGVLSGTPTTTATASSLTFMVSDSGSPVQTKSVALALTVYSSTGIMVSVSRHNVGLTLTQTLSISATTPDSDGVKWSASGSGCSGTTCGTFSTATSLTGVSVTYTAPSTAGIYTITASSVTNNSISDSATAGVTDLAAVASYHNDNARDGSNTQEYALNTTNVATATFGKLFSCTVDEAVYTQPLWVPNLTVSSAKRNVVYVATENDGLYAFDADTNTSPCTPLWHVNLLDTAHGGTSGETVIPSVPTPGVHLVGLGYGDIQPEVGVTGTPVIDLTTNTLYVVSKSMNSAGTLFYQRLHAIDLTTGNEKFSGPVNITATYPGTGDGNTTTTFVARQENQRCGLALVNGVVYVAWAAHEDDGPYYGWIVGYNAGNLAQTSVLNVDPNDQAGGIWMSGGAPSADASGALYLITGNGGFDATNGSAPTNDYGDSFLKLTAGLGVTSYFTPTDQASDASGDQDFGAGGAAVLVNLPVNGTNPTGLVVGGGKDGYLYSLNRSSLGGSGDSNAWQRINLNHGIFSTSAFWNSNLYVGPAGGAMQMYTLSASTAKLTLAPNATSINYQWPGASPSVTSMPDFSNGIVWALDNHTYCTNQASACGPAVLHAYDATNLATELWNSTQGSGNAAGYAVKFTVPTIANGKVYIGTRGNNIGGADNLTSTPGELDVYGLLN
jgi:hypothetical protein